MIHVALCFHDASGEYYKHALVTALSVLDNTKEKVCLHVVHDETLEADAVRLFEKICAQHGQRIAFHTAEKVAAEVVVNLPPSMGVGTLYRAMLPGLIASDKVLYLDCDIVSLADVGDIFSIDLSGKYLGAAKMPPWQAEKWIRKYGLQGGFCVNAGVLLMNLKRLREEMPDLCGRYAALAAGKAKACDQAATNLLFNPVPDAYAFLPEDYNFRTELSDHSVLPFSEYHGKIIHFAGKKPWQVWTQPAFFYWKYYSRLFPEKDVFEHMERLAPYEHAYLFSYVLRDGKRRRRLRRLHEASTHGVWKALLKRLF